MPKRLKQELKAAAKRKGLTGARADAYVYGTLKQVEQANSTTPKTKRKR